MTVMLVIIGVVVAFMIALFCLSRWADREAAYEPEELSHEEGNLYRLGIALGANQPGIPGP